MSNYEKALELIRDLEHQYGSVTKVPGSDNRLIKATKLLGGKVEDPAISKILYFLNLGFPVDEVSDLTQSNVDIVYQVAKRKGLPIMERFRWVSDDGIYAVSYPELRKFSSESVHKTFKVFSSIPKGSKYVVKTSLYRKSTNDISDYRKTRVAYELKQ